jgi:hypothetical protein
MLHQLTAPTGRKGIAMNDLQWIESHVLEINPADQALTIRFAYNGDTDVIGFGKTHHLQHFPVKLVYVSLNTVSTPLVIAPS